MFTAKTQSRIHSSMSAIGIPLVIPMLRRIQKAACLWELRQTKRSETKESQLHKALDRIWENGYMTKEQVYIWLQAKLDMPANVMHIGKLNEYYCNRIIYECNRAYRNMRTVT